eukprot:CAMPEP_0170318468 /NCGR_PEP_ID=MMETSP0116_2-20130129/59930_1 /TAXON_ID=400756 /ORGANISM="Durinskia baltica, Strain CSIRO CS-38" /LENGTH=36 /DNA_ID= /DNA_START= /DNA_END= /DNA_ORIENTATION=
MAARIDLERPEERRLLPKGRRTAADTPEGALSPGRG